jgi:hypothetical protein
MARVSLVDSSPNTITLIAALFLVIPHLYTWVKYGNSFEGYVDNYDALIVGICFMVYIVSLFNVDFR